MDDRNFRTIETKSCANCQFVNAYNAESYINCRKHNNPEITDKMYYDTVCDSWEKWIDGKPTEEEIKSKLHVNCRTCFKLDLICVGKTVTHKEEKLTCHDQGPEESKCG